VGENFEFMHKKYLTKSLLIGFRVFILGLILACIGSTQLVSLASPSFHSLARRSPTVSGQTPSNWGNEIGSVNLKNPLDQLATPKAANFPTNLLPQGQFSLSPSGNLVAPATATLQILATDTDGAVDTVEFFNGNQSLGFGLKNGSN